MTTYLTAEIGFNIETTTNIRAVPTYWVKFGGLSMDNTIKYPAEVATLIEKLAAASAMPSSLKIKQKTVAFTIPFQVVDGYSISLLAATVTDGTVFATSYYNHKFSTIDLSSAFETKPFTTHFDIFSDEAMTSLVNAVDVAGCHVTRLRLYCNETTGWLVYGELDIEGQRITDRNATTNLLGESSGANSDAEGVQGQYVANRLTNANKGPLPADSVNDSLVFKYRTNYQANPQGFIFNRATANSLNIGGTISFADINASGYGDISAGGTDYTAKFAGFDFEVQYTMYKAFIKRPGYTNYGVDISQYAQYNLVKSVGKRSLKLILNDDSATYNEYLKNLKGTDSEAIYLRFEKEDDSTVWFSLCFAPTTGTVQNIMKESNMLLPISSETNFFDFSYDFTNVQFVFKDKEAALRSVT